MYARGEVKNSQLFEPIGRWVNGRKRQMGHVGDEGEVDIADLWKCLENGLNSTIGDLTAARQIHLDELWTAPCQRQDRPIGQEGTLGQFDLKFRNIQRSRVLSMSHTVSLRTAGRRDLKLDDKSVALHNEGCM